MQLILLSALVLASAWSAGESPRAGPQGFGDGVATVFQGRVVDAEGQPAHAAVVVSSDGGEAVTDAEGRFELTVRLTPDVREVQVTAVAGSGSGSSAAISSVPVVAGAVHAVPLLGLQQGGGCPPGWLPTFSTASGSLSAPVVALAVFDDGNGPALYAGGNFTSAGGVTANRIAKWDGTSWSPVGLGFDNSVVALEVYDDGNGPALYAAGSFTSAGGSYASRIAKWDGLFWSPLGLGVNSSVRALEVFDDGSGGGPALYVAGTFTMAGGMPIRRVARWDGVQWSAVGNEEMGVYAMQVFDDGSGSGPALYAGGFIHDVGGMSASHVVRWDGTQWLPLASGVDDTVRTLTVFDDGSGSGPCLYAGGVFQMAGGVPASRVAKWNGTSWSPLGTGMDDKVHTLLAFDALGGPALYAGGSFTTAGGQSANGIARWDGSAWSALGPGVGGGTDIVIELAAFDDGSGQGAELFAGGNFTVAGNVQASYVAKWDGAGWSATHAGGTAVDNHVWALTVFDDGAGPALYAAGRFLGAGSAVANHVARWNGTDWTALGAGTNSAVQALTVFDDGSGGPSVLIAAGSFTEAGGAPASCIASWDGTTWTPLGNGLDSHVYALAVFDDGNGPALYAGGFFTTAGRVPASHVARWDGTAWSSLASGTTAEVLALEVFDDLSGGGPALYAGGGFTQAGTVAASRIAKWDGVSWSSLGSGLAGGFVGTYVSALTVFDDGIGRPSLVAGGHFTLAGGTTARRVARWDGVSWSPLGTGVTGPAIDECSVQSLEVFDDGNGPSLYVAGTFSRAGGVPAKSIARWNGQDWSALGQGIDDDANVDVVTLQAWQSGLPGAALYAGGDFTTSASGDRYLAKWGCPFGDTGIPFCFGIACPCGNDDPQAGCTNSSGAGALLGSSGTASVTGDDLVLTVSQAAPNQFGILYMGGAKAEAPFGDGQRCVEAGPYSICRFPVHATGPAGTFTEGPGIAAFSSTQLPQCHIDPGDTWHFQGWFRDPAGPCGEGFNLTQGLSVQFVP